MVRETGVQSQVESNQKMVLDATLLNTQHYKVRIKGKVDESKEWSCAFPNTLVKSPFKKEPSLLTFIYVKLIITSYYN